MGAVSILSCIRSPEMAPSTLWQPLSIPQAKFLAAKEFEVLYGGAKGGAKTESLVVAPLHQIGHERFKGLLLREHFDELQEIQDRCKRYYVPLGAQWIAKDNVWRFPSGAGVWVGYCERMEHTKEYQGREWTYVGFDEIGNLKSEEIFDTLLAEIRSPDKSLIPMARCTANPGGEGHAWVKRRFVTATNYGRTIAKRTFDIPNHGPTEITTRFIPSRVSDNPVYANNAQYMAQLYALPEARRRQLLEGDWDAGEGMALDELSRDKHWKPRPEIVPDHWYVWGAFDWGFQHPWWFGTGVMKPNGKALLLDSISGWRQRPDEIVTRVTDHATKLFPMHGARRYAKLVAGRDCFHELKARGEATPTIAEHFERAGMVLWPANVSRVFGLTNLQQWFAWRGRPNEEPLLTIANTPGNENTWQCLQGMVVDPRNREDALKVDADPRTGLGGDDPYDGIRYLMADRPYVPKELPAEKPDPSIVDPLNEVFDAIVSGNRPEVGHGAWDQLPAGF